MKFLASFFTYYLGSRNSQRNLQLLLRFFLGLSALVILYSVLFHVIMGQEGQKHSWLTGLYWTLTVMSTLGFGDITFQSDVGRVFSIVVLLSGMISLLVVMPFTFIKFFYEPWMEAQAAARAPRSLPEDTRGHVILTHTDPVTMTLIHRLNTYGYPYVLLVSGLEEALRLYDGGYRIVLGELDDPETYRNARVGQAALVAATANDIINTNIAFTVRELSEKTPVIATANAETAEDILRLAGSTHVFRLGEMMGQSLARRTIGGDARAHIIGRFDQLLIAEATAAGTPLVGKTLAETHLRENVGINVVGLWERGRFEMPGPDSRLSAHSVLVLAGSAEQLKTYDELFCIYHVMGSPVVIIGGGRVGRATGTALLQRGIDYRIVEQRRERIRNPEKYIEGNAADLETLERAGIQGTPTVIITTHDDDTNIYLTIFCRRLRPDIQIISRATLERNVSTLHRAGADFVMSYASMGASVIFNLLERSDLLMLAEGLNVFRVKVPESLAGKNLVGTPIRKETGCSVIAVNDSSGLRINPDPNIELEQGAELILIGTVEAERAFLKEFGA
ncbi:MAG TPA: NAD-binding protein [Methylomirabilota bacterium]|nr:NAD-binding protein [Methylomirabilota bacterium]